MAFGPGIESILMKLINTPFSAADIQHAKNGGVEIQEVAQVELKIWLDFCGEIGALSVNDDCIQTGRVRYFKNIVRFMGVRSQLPDALQRAQICTKRAGRKAAEIASDMSAEISVANYEAACDAVLRNMVSALKKMPKQTQEDAIVMAPVCRDEFKQGMSVK